MLPYWLVLAWYAVGAINNPTVARDRSRNSLLLLLSLLLLTLFVGLRLKVGADWLNYIDMYDAARELSFQEIIRYSDPGYMALNGIANWLHIEIWFVNLICAAIFVWGLTRFAAGEPNPWLAIAVAVPYLVIVVAMGYTRQSVAIGIILASIPVFKRHHYVRFLGYFAVAALFHKTSVVVLPLIALSTVRHRFAVYVAAAAAGFLLFVFFFQAFLETMMAGYLDQAMESDGATVRVAMNLIPALLVLVFQRRFVISEQERALWRNFSLASLAMLVLLVTVDSSTVVDRVALYLMPLQIFALGRLPYAFPRGDRPNAQLTIAVLTYSAIVQWVWLTFAAHSKSWLPYQSFL